MKLLTNESVDALARHFCDEKSPAKNLKDLELGFDTLCEKLSLKFSPYKLELDQSRIGGSKVSDMDALKIYGILGQVNGLRLTDQRLWTTLAFSDIFSAFAKSRWPDALDPTKGKSTLRTHWFASTQRDFQRNHVIASEWWVAALASRVAVELESQPEKILAVLRWNSDFTSNILSRPTQTSSTTLLSCIVGLAEEYRNSGKPYPREELRSFFSAVNFIQGRRSLFALSQEEVTRVIRPIWEKAIGKALP